MTDQEYLAELLVATRSLAAKVDTLGSNLQIAQEQQRRTRILVVVVTCLSILSFVAVMGMGYLFTRVQNAVRVNKENAITNCENANDSRKANQVLWTYVISLSRNTADPAETKILDAYQKWIDDLYASRDCTNLSKKYPIPPPPAIPVP